MDLPTDQTLDGRWRLDLRRSSVEFRAGHFWGLATVKGHFDEYEGRLDLNGGPAIELTARDQSIPLELDARARRVGGELEIEAVATSIPRTRRVHLRCLSAR